MTKKQICTFFDTLFDTAAGLICVSQLLYYALRFSADAYYNGGSFPNLPCYICLITMLFFSFSLIRITVIYNQPLRESFWAKEIDTSLKSRLLFLIKLKEFWIKACIVAFIYLLLPLNLTFKALAVALQISGSFADKLKILAVFFPLLLTVAVFAHLSAYKLWSKNREPGKYNKKAHNKEILKMCVIYIADAFAFVMGIPLLAGVSSLLYHLLTVKQIIVIAIFILIAAPILYRMIRAYCKRRSCIRQLKNVCEKKGYGLSKISNPYRSLFRFSGGESFQVTVGEKSYSCKFITARKRNVPLSIYPNGILVFHHIVRIRKVELFQFSTKREFGYESGNQKILIVNPVPKQVYTVSAGKMTEIDNGYMIGDYKFFTATAFLRALGLNVLDR